ncbi:MAG: hypothetical protein Q9219_006542, partial [cf. Caloplaca sp. 3 TL-2023]
RHLLSYPEVAVEHHPSDQFIQPQQANPKEIDSIEHQSINGACPVAAKLPEQLPPLSCEDCLPQLSNVNSTSDIISPDLQLYTNSDLKESCYNQRPTLDSIQKPPNFLLTKFVSPLFLEPFQDPSAVPTHYRPKYTTPLFRETFKNQWLEGRSKKRDHSDLPSLPSLFDLEMMAGESTDNTSPSQTNAPATPTDAEWTKSQLSEYGLRQEDDDAWGRYPELQQAVNAVLSRPRDSVPSPKVVAQYNAKLKTYRDLNEDTFLSEIIPLLFGKDRWVPASQPQTFSHVQIKQSGAQSVPQLPTADFNRLAEMAQLLPTEDRVSVDFYDSGMITITNRDFSRNLPFLNDDSVKFHPDLNRALMKAAGITNPRPDKCFAVAPHKIDWPAGFIIPTVIRVMLEIVRACFHTFLLLGGKSADGSIVEARNQANRGGALVVNAERQVIDFVGISETPGADLRTFMFSVVLTPDMLEVWVHWAEVHDNGPVDHKSPYKVPLRTTYHMNQVFETTLRDRGDGTLGKIRRILHNIMDWGLGARLEKLKPVHEAIVDHARSHDPTTGLSTKKVKTK